MSRCSVHRAPRRPPGRPHFEACSSPASAAQADGDGLNAPEASTKAACWQRPEGLPGSTKCVGGGERSVKNMGGPDGA